MLSIMVSTYRALNIACIVMQHHIISSEKEAIRSSTHKCNACYNTRLKKLIYQRKIRL